MGKITKKSENNKQRLSAFFASTKSRPESNKLKVAETTNKLENDKTIATPTKPAKPPTKKRVVVNAKEKKEVKASPVSKKSKSNASRRRKELIDRVRAKGQKTIEEAFQGMASSSAKKQRTMLSRLLDMTDSISFMYTSSNKNVMYLGEVVATLKESSDIPLSQRKPLLSDFIQ
ncbi:5278_t:CDS:2 [Scutellospora calospora]|uniref:5278_t:CDS:1 n=1 Tax=Scutellospora calospora TaxID=85575 RepID=A0ACA9L7W8_9GLOM|nr:5278_t:CDS:2 [Scutellospora calospora]